MLRRLSCKVLWETLMFISIPFCAFSLNSQQNSIKQKMATSRGNLSKRLDELKLESGSGTGRICVCVCVLKDGHYN